MQFHDFHESLRKSNDARTESFWQEAYRAAFPDLRSILDNARDNGAQRCGVDRLVVLRSTQVIRIDEKARFEDFGDMLIEIGHVHNRGSRSPGWIEKDLTIDFLAYGVVPARRCYLFPWPLLRAAWVKHGESWKDRARAREQGYRVVKAHNRHWVTYNITLPMDHVRSAVAECHVIQLPAP